MVEPLEGADLGAQAERGQRVDPAQAPQPGDRHGPGRVGRELLELGLDPLTARQQHVVGVQVVGDRQLRGTVGELQRSEPRAVPARPRRAGPS